MVAHAGGLTVLPIPNTRVRGIEVIHLTDMGDNTLTLDASDLRSMSASTNTLTVVGDAGDEVVIETSGAETSTDGGFKLYAWGGYTLRVADAVAVSDP